MDKNSKKMTEIKDRVYGRTVGIYDDVCRQHDVDWLIKKVESQQKEKEELSNKIDGYLGTVEALTEEFAFLTGRMQKLQERMLLK